MNIKGRSLVRPTHSLMLFKIRLIFIVFTTVYKATSFLYSKTWFGLDYVISPVWALMIYFFLVEIGF